MINEIVYHKTKGKGTIVSVNPNESNIYITVAFENEKLEFNFPNAFESFLEAESDELKAKVNEALAEKQKKKDEEERKKQLQKAKNELRRAQAELELLERKATVSKMQPTSKKVFDIGVQLTKGQVCGTVARDIYEQGCKKFGWSYSEIGKFTMLKKLYSEIATPEGYSVWFLPHSNKTGTDNKSVENRIYANKVEQWWFEKNHYPAPKRNRLMFYKEDNMYYFGGVYLFDEERIEEINGKIYYVEKFDIVSEEYPEKKI